MVEGERRGLRFGECTQDAREEGKGVADEVCGCFTERWGCACQPEI